MPHTTDAACLSYQSKSQMLLCEPPSRGEGIAGIEHCVVVNTNCGGAGNYTAQCNFMHSGCWFAIYLLHVFVSFNYVKLVYHLFAVDNIQALLRLIQALASNIIYKVCAVLPCSSNDAGEQGCKAEKRTEERI